MENEPANSEFKKALRDLPAELGFIETSSLRQARAEAVTAMTARDWSLIPKLLSGYEAEAEKLVEQYQDEDFERARIGLIVAEGLMWEAAGEAVIYRTAIENALAQAAYMSFDDILPILSEAQAKINEEQNQSK